MFHLLPEIHSGALIIRSAERDWFDYTTLAAGIMLGLSNVILVGFTLWQNREHNRAILDLERAKEQREALIGLEEPFFNSLLDGMDPTRLKRIFEKTAFEKLPADRMIDLVKRALRSKGLREDQIDRKADEARRMLITLGKMDASQS